MHWPLTTPVGGWAVGIQCALNHFTILTTYQLLHAIVVNPHKNVSQTLGGWFKRYRRFGLFDTSIYFS